MRLSQAAAWLGAELRGDDGEFFGVSSDTRGIAAGVLFVALRGPRFDGHDYVTSAAAAGVAALLVEQAVDVAVPQLVVRDSRMALGRLAAAWRLHCNTPLAAVTGSNGKTTVKEMARAILRQRGAVLATEGNLNNDIGVPLTLLRLTRDHRFAVIEMGANHPGEIAYLTELTRPDAAVINNAAPAHLEGFGSVEGVARAKGEIYGGLRPDGVAVINTDDAFASLWYDMAGTYRQLTFGLGEEAEVTAQWRPVAEGTQLNLQTPFGTCDFVLPLPGRHNVMNALAAASVTLALGCGLDAVAAGLSAMVGVAGRLQSRAGLNGATLLDDSYNANPESLRAAIEVLAGCAGRRVLVLGDMGELGQQAQGLHREVGTAARAAGIDALYGVGPLSSLAVEAFGAGGRHYSEQALLVEALRQELAPQVTVLIKGSRSAHMEDVVDALAGGGRN